MKKFMQKQKITGFLIALALAVVSVTACGGGAGSKTAVKQTAAEGAAARETAAEGAAVGDASAGETASDAAGASKAADAAKTAGAAGGPERIVSGYYITTSILIALGLKDRVAGIEAKADKRPIYKLSAPELLALPNVGTAKDFDLEGCAALKPDLVILPRKQAEQADILSGLGVKSMVVNPESMEELKKTIEEIAVAAGVKKRADRLLAYYDEKTKWLSTLSGKGESRSDKLKIYLSGNSDILRTAGKNMYQNELIELAGGTNAAGDLTDSGWAGISYEKLLAYDPDYIIISSDAEYTREDVLADEMLKGLKAVQNQKVYGMPSAIEAWDSPVPSGILGSMWLASLLNEDAYPFEQFQTDAAAFYKEFYEIEIDTSLITR